MSVITYVNSINKRNFSLFVCMLFSAVISIGMSHHEMWRDEYEWFLFRKHNGIFDPNDPCYIFYNTLCCTAIWIKPTLFSFQVLHFVIILGTVGTVCFLSPFNNLEKILISLGYFFAYEYGVITRPYGLATLLVFLLSYEICKERRRYGLISLLILILAGNNPLSLMLASGFVFYLSLDLFLKEKTQKLDFWKNKSLLLWISLFFFGSLLLATYYAIYLPKISPLVQYRGGTPPLITMINQIWNAYVPIPDLTEKVRFWWTNIFNFSICYPPGYTFGWKDVSLGFLMPFVASLFFFMVVIAKFSKNPPVCLTYIITTFVLVVFIQHFMKCYTIRYLGFLYITFLFCYWIFRVVSKNESELIYAAYPSVSDFHEKHIKTKKLLCFLSRSFPAVLYFILISQVFAGFYALSKDYKYKFSHSEDLAKYIKWNNYQNTHVLAGYPDYASECVCALLDTKVYFPQTGKFSYHDDAFNPSRKNTMPLNEVISECVQLAESNDKPVLLILNFPIMATKERIFAGPAMITPTTSIKLIQDFPDEVICGDEVYWLYELNQVH